MNDLVVCRCGTLMRAGLQWEVHGRQCNGCRVRQLEREKRNAKTEQILVYEILPGFDLREGE